MGRTPVLIPLNKKNVTKSEWDDYIAWQRYRNDERMKYKLKETDLYISSRELSPETWESILNESISSTNSDTAEESPISIDNGDDTTFESNVNTIASNLNSEFIPSKKYAGKKNGYVFKSGSKGLGYYRDDKSNSDSEDIYGPMPTDAPETATDGSAKYNNQALKYEHSTSSKHSQDGKRMPRKNENGMTLEEIEKYESLGYVMSGSSHWRMNQAKLLKEENYTAQEQRAKAMLNFKERANKEAELINNLKEMLKKRNDAMDKSNR